LEQSYTSFTIEIDCRWFIFLIYLLHHDMILQHNEANVNSIYRN
jgi:hypothetical protein